MKFFCDYIFVWSLSNIILMFVKGLYGRNRPHFIDMCQPSVVNCTIGTLVTDFTCTNPNLSPLRLKTISRSFPSGHAGLATYFSVYMIWFLQHRVPKLRVNYFVPFLQCVLFAYMILIGITRIFDNAHHPIDVLFGSLFGILFATFSVSVEA